MRPRGHELPHPGVDADLGVLEELDRGAALQSSVLNLSLTGEVVSRVDGGHHPVHREEGGEVGGVGGDEDEGEEPPDST